MFGRIPLCREIRYPASMDDRAGYSRRAGLVALLAGALIWLPLFHLLFVEQPELYRSGTGIPPKAKALAASHIAIWADEAGSRAEIEKMRGRNAEWDFTARSFFVWSLANMALREPGTASATLPIMDRIIDETVRLERERGPFFFLMPYAGSAPFRMQPVRSIFLDGEIALMMGLRRLVSEHAGYRTQMRERVDTMVGRMEKSPVMCVESYPNECWLFCNSIGLAAIRVSDHLDGTDHGDLFRRWIETAKKKLIEPKTGLLLSAFTLDGDVMDGPEGSSIWLAAHCLSLIDPGFAADQYRRARQCLRVRLAGFDYAWEWPRECPGSGDVDSGPIIPLLDLSAGSTGLAFVGAATFGDGEFLQGLHAALELGGFPIRDRDRLKYAGSNAVGDAVLLYSMVLGPAWDAVASNTSRPSGLPAASNASPLPSTEVQP